MVILLKDAFEEAEKSGATKENAAIEIIGKLYPRWIAWLLNKFYKTPLSLGYVSGYSEDGVLRHTSIWTAKFADGSKWQEEITKDL